MVSAPAAMKISQDTERDIEPYRPASVFISYASEDHDIAQAIYKSLQDLGETIFDQIKIFLDSKSIEGGDEIRADIKAGLRKSDFLMVLYTGLFKRSHGYTGWEVGFFEGLIEEDKNKYGQRVARSSISIAANHLQSVREFWASASMSTLGTWQEAPSNTCRNPFKALTIQMRWPASFTRLPIAQKIGFRLRCAMITMSSTASVKNAASR